MALTPERGNSISCPGCRGSLTIYDEMVEKKLYQAVMSKSCEHSQQKLTPSRQYKFAAEAAHLAPTCARREMCTVTMWSDTQKSTDAIQCSDYSTVGGPEGIPPQAVWLS
ncbi:Hypothetical predicted protein [Pelobates cultripes]|uniref:Uncharacterized protein n=1 Tax=Pelobates cultripes TaxID=61616 RepID=A0AAD1S132_PELCU|nr:Hypothetical predicted protein [Pelobates cultripes]